MSQLITLVPLSIFCGVLTALVFRRFRSRETGHTINRILAHVIELRLFFDEPGVIWQVHRDLLRENLTLFRQIALPMLITAPLLVLLVWQADGVYGRGPLPAGQAAVVTAHIASGDLDASLAAPPGVAVESLGVRVPQSREVSWRIRPVRPFDGTLSINAPVDRLDIPWPRTTIGGVSWMVWFFAISALAALLTPKRGLRYSAVAIVFILSSHSAQAADKTPVIVISIDTLRADHAHGPNLDSFAENGTVFEHIDTQIPLTLPSHTVLMTSTYPFTTHVEVNGELVPPSAVTLASILHANGYKTAAFIGSMILNRGFGLDKGFDFYDSPFESAAASAESPYSPRVRRDAALVSRAARQWLDANRNEPVFAFLHFYDLHTPYTLPQVAGLTPNKTGYAAELAHVDQVLGGLRDALKRDGLWDKALIVLLADHGESLGDHGETSHGYFIYESTMHVPLIVHWPTGAPKYPARIADSGGLIDVAPTILDFLHIAAPPSFAGTSLLPGHGAREVYGESIYPQETFGWAALRSVQDGRWKYIEAPKPELYDLANDPQERTNLIATHSMQAFMMKTHLGGLLKSYLAKATAPPPISGDAPSQTREALRSLGYTGGRAPQQANPPDPKDKLAEQEAYERGLTELYTAHYPQAIATLQKIVTTDARNLPALCALGEARLRSGNAAKALALWQQALERDPQYRPAAESIGGYWLARHDLSKGCPFVPTAQQCRGR